jgi:protein-tyrosine phosphatase
VKVAVPSWRDYADNYFWLAHSASQSVALLFREMTTDGILPCVVGCGLGKDRTGVVSAILLAALGATRRQILADYVKSTRLLRLDKARVDRFGETYGIDRASLWLRARCDRRAMSGFFDAALAKHGTVARLLATMAIEPDTLYRLDETLVGGSTPEDVPQLRSTVVNNCDGPTD